MLKNKKWKIFKKELRRERIIQILLENREMRTKTEKEEFLNPKLEDVTIDSVGIDQKQLEKTLRRIQKAIEDKEQVIVYGDYDVDGITGTAILWETLHSLKTNVLPYIPHRVDEGYGLSIKGIQNVESKVQNCKLIITVDNGIVANDAVQYANEQGIDVIITDHHTMGEKLPDAFAIVHTTKLCGAGVAWMLSKEIKNDKNEEHLDLVALATVADLVPLTNKNRALLKNGLSYLQNTKRLGLQALCNEAQIDPQKISVYEIGHIIGPRLNAMGRLESAMDSLRLLCTKDPYKAQRLANLLSVTNRERQLLTQSQSLHAIERVKREKVKNIVILAHDTYEEGIIGLIAGKLVEEFYRPSIVIAKGEKISKASARSVAGFNMIEFIRTAREHLINAGGHPMAAGFTIETEKIVMLQEALEKLAEEQLNDEILTRILKIDCEIPFSMINQKFYTDIQQLAPFGMGNPEPVFVSRDVHIEEIKIIGRERKHLKLLLSPSSKGREGMSAEYFRIEALAFGMAEQCKDFRPGQHIDVAYSIEENEWNGRKKLQVKVKDMKLFQTS